VYGISLDSERDGRASQVERGTNGFSVHVSPFKRHKTSLGSIY